jgi:Iap family predicted aminopeptidase
MPRSLSALLCAVLLTFTVSHASAGDPVREAILGSAYSAHDGYAVLQRICDEAGGRLAGSAANERTLRILEEELGVRGVRTHREPFSMSGWERGADAVDVLTPEPRRLRAVALGYVDAHTPIEASLAWAGYGREKDFANARGAIALVTSEAPKEGEAPLRYEVIAHAAAAGARGVLFINDKPGGLVLAGVSNFLGKPAGVPGYSITFEEGQRLRRLLAGGQAVTARVTTNSRCKQVETANLVASFPGKRKARIVVGAHVDGWDIGQGAVDNGVGSATVFEIARLLARYSLTNEYSVDCVWFNAEELGIWGAGAYVKAHAQDSIVAMVNLDMPGRPTGINVMGHDALVPFARDFLAGLCGYTFTDSVISVPWSNSDHQCFLLEGIPSFTFMGHLEKESVFHYHDTGDTFDKVEKRALVDASAVATLLVRDLANTPSLPLRRKTVEERIDSFRKSGMEQRLKRQGQWPF